MCPLCLAAAGLTLAGGVSARAGAKRIIANRAMRKRAKAEEMKQRADESTNGDSHADAEDRNA